MGQNNKLALLTDSPDSYLDIFDVFYTLYRKNWNNTIFNCYLTVEESTKNYIGIKVVRCGKGLNQIERLVFALSSIDAEYIMLFDEDIIFSKQIKNQELLEITDIMDRNNIDYWRLTINPKQRKIPFKGLPFVNYIDLKKRYGKSLMAEIWKKTALIDLFSSAASKNQTGWDIENGWIHDTLTTKTRYDEHYVLDKRDIFGIIHGVSKGKWIPSSVKKIKIAGGYIDFTKRKKMSLIECSEMKLKAFGRIFIPNKLIFFLKKVLSRIGFSFSAKY